MAQGLRIKKFSAVTAIACAAFLGFAQGSPTPLHAQLTTLAGMATGSSSAYAQQPLVRQSFPDPRKDDSLESREALERYQDERAALIGNSAPEAPQEQSAMFDYKDYLITLLGFGFVGALAVPYLRPRASRALERFNRALLEKAHGAKMRATWGLNDESGRVAAARLSGRQESDLDDSLLDTMHQALEAESKTVAEEMRSGMGVGAGMRVSRVVMPTPEAIARSPIPPSARRDRSGLADAAKSALLNHSISRSTVGDDSAKEVSAEEKARVLQMRLLSDRADRMYRDLQRYYGFGSRTQLQGVLTPELFAQLEGGLADQDGSGLPQVLSLVHRVLELNETADQFLAKVSYSVTLRFDGSGPEHSQEVFTFVKSKSPGVQHWKLAEIKSANQMQMQEQDRLEA